MLQVRIRWALQKRSFAELKAMWISPIVLSSGQCSHLHSGVDFHAMVRGFNGNQGTSPRNRNAGGNTVFLQRSQKSFAASSAGGIDYRCNVNPISSHHFPRGE